MPKPATYDLRNREKLRTVAAMRHGITAPATPAEAFRAYRLRAGLTVAELAERSGVDKATLHRIERGDHTKPHMRTLIAVADVLGVTPADLLAEEVPQ